MKKEFIKPELKKINLNFCENIVASQSYSEIGGFRSYFEDPSSCIIHDSGYVYYDLADPNKFYSEKVHGCLNLWFSQEKAARLLGIE